MGMPKIIGSDVTREQSISNIISSVSLEQAALSHILNAEGKKIQSVIAMVDVTSTEILAVNDSVKSTVESITQLESMLLSKLKLFGDKLLPPMPIKFYFNKQDEYSHKGISGAVFVLIDSDGRTVETATSSKGRVLFQNQYAGTYTLKEKTAPIGYYPDLTTEYTVVISEDGIVTIDGTLSKEFIINNTPYLNLTVNKVDDLGNPLSDGEFLLAGSTYSYNAKSGADGIALFERIMPGEYILSETRTHDGYRKSDETHQVSVAADGTIKIDSIVKDTITIKNKELMDIAIRLIFIDNNDTDGYRPEYIHFSLYLNGVYYYDYTPKAQDSFYYIHKVEKYDDAGNINVISFVQDAIPYYRTDYEELTIINTLEMFDIKGKIIWDDNNDANEKQPNSVTLTLFGVDSIIEQKTVTKEDLWKFSFNGLYKSINYTLMQNNVQFYDTSIGKWDITNVYKDLL